jgi:NhaP-type Na+/H+ or K+/H+ antiporter
MPVLGLQHDQCTHMQFIWCALHAYPHTLHYACTHTHTHTLHRAWGNLVVLYIGVHIVRLVVVAACTPVLIATGSSMDWKQVTVLAFGGLRGVLTLTLALIVSETEVSLEKNVTLR